MAIHGSDELIVIANEPVELIVKLEKCLNPPLIVS